jgi:hypothetical protein
MLLVPSNSRDVHFVITYRIRNLHIQYTLQHCLHLGELYIFNQPWEPSGAGRLVHGVHL